MKKLFLLSLLLALPLLASAYDIAVENDGVKIYYNYKNDRTELEVTYETTNYNSYTGVVKIPEEVTYLSRTRKVTSIGAYAFYNCRSLTSVTIPSSVTSIGDRAFYYCYKLTSVSIPSNVTSIGEYAFYFCSGLTSLTIGKSVKSIGAYAFVSCSKLTSVTIPNSVTSIGAFAFNYCDNLTTLTLGKSVTTIENSAFEDCINLTSLTIPNSVTFIGEFAFNNCTNLASLTIGNSVTYIGDFAFAKSEKLTSLVIPNTVTYIGSNAFRYCSSLTSVTSEMEEPCSIDDYCFPKVVFDNASLYVPEGKVGVYNSKNYWNKFAYIEEINIKCATPTISFTNNKLKFSCATKSVQYHYTINDADIKSGVASSVTLSATYEISVYATKSGYKASDVATATLVWTNAVLSQTTGITTSAKAFAESIPVLISAQDGNLVVRSEQENQYVAAYSIDGKVLGSAKVNGGQAIIPTNLPKDEIVIVKVGNRSVKVKM